MKCLLKRRTIAKRWRHLEQRPDFHVVGHRPRTHGKSGQLVPDLSSYHGQCSWADLEHSMYKPDALVEPLAI